MPRVSTIDDRRWVILVMARLLCFAGLNACGAEPVPLKVSQEFSVSCAVEGYTAAPSPCGRYVVAIGGMDGPRTNPAFPCDWAIAIWDVTEKRLRSHRTVEMNDVRDICFTPDGRLTLIHDYVGRVIILDLASGTLLHNIETRHTNEWAGNLVVSPDGKIFVVGEYRMPVRFYDIETGQLLRKKEVGGHFGSEPLHWLNNDTLFHREIYVLAVNHFARRLVVRDANSFEILRTIEDFLPRTKRASNFDILPDHQTLINCFSDEYNGGERLKGYLDLTDFASMGEICRFDYDSLSPPLFSSDGRWMAMRMRPKLTPDGEDNPSQTFVTCYDLMRGEVVGHFERRAESGHSGGFSNTRDDGSVLLVLAGESTLLFEIPPENSPTRRPMTVAEAYAAIQGSESVGTWLGFCRLQAEGEAALKLFPNDQEPLTDEEFRQFVRQLDADEFPIRETAQRRLSTSLVPLRPKLEQALRQSQSTEQQHRLEQLLEEPETEESRVAKRFHILRQRITRNPNTRPGTESRLSITSP